MTLNRRADLTLALLASTAIVAVAPGEAYAAVNQERSFALAAGPLRDALLQFGAQSGLQLLYTSELVANRESPAVVGRMTGRVALERLLAGSGLSWTESRPGVLILQRRATPLASEEAYTLDEVVVTGTLLRGPGETPSPVTSMSRDDMDRAGHGTVADALSALPQNYGGSGTPVSLLAASDPVRTNSGLATGVNLRGLGPDATLVLINGRRMAGTGTRGDFNDVSTVPMSAVARLDVLLDGASALYGSDAVGGVVNIVMRRDFDGHETRMRAGAARGGAEDLMLAHTVGRAWDGGQALLSYEYQEQGAFSVADRDYTRTGDLRPFGGSDHRLYYSAPGNIVGFDFAAGAYTALWAIRPGASGVAEGPADFVAGDVNLAHRRQGADLMPDQQRHSAFALLRQRLTESVEVSFDARYSERDFRYAMLPPASIITVTDANPHFVSPNGSTSHQIAYSFADEIGPAVTDGESRSHAVSLGFDIALPAAWNLEVYGAYAEEKVTNHQSVMLHSLHMNEALGTTPDNPATPYNPTVDGYLNLFGDGTANSRAVLDFISSGYGVNVDRSEVASFNAVAQGSVLELPAGQLRVAVGAHFRTERLSGWSEEWLYTAEPMTAPRPEYERRLGAAFVEARVPLVAAANRRPGVERLELSLAGRFEDYDDVGSTANPKVGLIWEPSADVRLRTTWGTSFRAPPLTAVFGRYFITAVDVSDGSITRLALLETGGNTDLRPETAETFTAGFDFRPTSISGLHVSATWFDTRFEDRIGQPGLENYAQVLINPDLASFVSVVDPSVPADRARLETLMNDPGFLLPGLFPVDAFTAIIDGRWVNAAVVRVRGFDVSAGYAFSRGEDDFRIEATASRLVDYERRLSPTASPSDLLGTVGYPVDLRGALAGFWTRGDLTGRLGLNYVGDYRDVAGTRISSWTTLDFQAIWAPSRQGWLEGVQAVFSVQNLLDQDPPFYDAPTGFGFDPGQSNALGRFVSIQITKRW